MILTAMSDLVAKLPVWLKVSGPLAVIALIFTLRVPSEIDALAQAVNDQQRAIVSLQKEYISHAREAEETRRILSLILIAVQTQCIQQSATRDEQARCLGQR